MTTIPMCTCTNCGKDEPLDVDFAECGRCTAVTYSYCSKYCQVKHWKEHKKRCPKYDYDDEGKKAYGKIPGRAHRFNGYYAPLTSKVVVTKFALLKLENSEATPNTHLITLRLSELPKEKKKPRLRLDSVGTLALSDLPEPQRNHMQHGMSMYPRGTFVIPYIMEVEFLGGLGVHMSPGMFAFNANPLLNERMPKDKPTLTMEGNLWIRLINEIAEGDRPDLFRSIKEKIKKNRARGVAMRSKIDKDKQ